MNGSILIFKPGSTAPEISSFTRPVELAELKAAIGGGWLEAVPRFTTIEHGGKVHRCVAFCDEEGKLDRGDRGRLPANRTQSSHRQVKAREIIAARCGA